MDILVTGGAGNIGSYIVDYLLEMKSREEIDFDNIIIIDNLSNSTGKFIRKNNNTIFYKLDISNWEEVDYVFSHHNIEYVFHCASMLINDSETFPRKAINTNIVGTFNIVEACNKYRVKKLVYSSSASVYGEPEEIPTNEECIFKLKNFVYGWTKITGEAILQSRCKTKWVGLRYYNVYSDRMSIGHFYTQVIPIFISQILNGEKVKVYGDGKQTMDLIHAKDVAIANIVCLLSENTNNKFYNIGTGKETTVIELANMISNIITGYDAEIEFIPVDVQKVRRRKANIDKIIKDTKWLPKCNLYEELKNIIYSE